MSFDDCEYIAVFDRERQAFACLNCSKIKYAGTLDYFNRDPADELQREYYRCTGLRCETEYGVAHSTRDYPIKCFACDTVLIEAGAHEAFEREV